MCLSRPPTDPERTRLRALLAEAAAESADPKSRRAALEDLVWSVATGKEFLFNH